MTQRKQQQSNQTWYILIALVFVIGLLVGLMGGVLIGRESVAAPIREVFSEIVDSTPNPALDMTRTAIGVRNQDTLNQLATLDAEGTARAIATP